MEDIFGQSDRHVPHTEFIDQITGLTLAFELIEIFGSFFA